MNKIAGINITAIRTENEINRNDGVINIGIWLEDEVFCRLRSYQYP